MMPVRKRCNYLSPFPTKDGRSLEKMNDICYKLLRIQRNLYGEKILVPTVLGGSQFLLLDCNSTLPLLTVDFLGHSGFRTDRCLCRGGRNGPPLKNPVTRRG